MHIGLCALTMVKYLSKLIDQFVLLQSPTTTDRTVSPVIGRGISMRPVCKSNVTPRIASRYMAKKLSARGPLMVMILA